MNSERFRSETNRSDLNQLHASVSLESLLLLQEQSSSSLGAVTIEVEPKRSEKSQKKLNDLKEAKISETKLKELKEVKGG